jgi:phosphoglycolate phosphatase
MNGSRGRDYLASFYREEQRFGPESGTELPRFQPETLPACVIGHQQIVPIRYSYPLRFFEIRFAMASQSTIVFDLDGTLVDTAPDLINALNFILDREGLAPVPLHAARNMIGAGARKLLERGLELEGRTVSLAELARLTDDFIAYYAEHIADASLPFDGLEAALDALAGSGYRLAVCTNKLEWLSKLLLDRLNLSSRFAAICGADTFGVAKPDPGILRQTVVRAGGQLASAIMVGDAGTDIGVARRAGVPVIGVSFGYTEVPIAELKPDRLIHHMAELQQAVASLVSQS